MGKGGARKGAGRPKGQGKYKEPTKPIRIPESMIADVMQYLSIKGYKLPLYASTIQAGFPSPADDYIEEQLDLNKYLIKHPTSRTVFPEIVLLIEKIDSETDKNLVIPVDKSVLKLIP